MRLINTPCNQIFKGKESSAIFATNVKRIQQLNFPETIKNTLVFS